MHSELRHAILNKMLRRTHLKLASPFGGTQYIVDMLSMYVLHDMFFIKCFQCTLKLAWYSQ